MTNVSELKKVLRWDSEQSEWRKLCPKSSNPVIRICNEYDKIMISVADTNSLKLCHEISGNLNENEAKLACTYMIELDNVQKTAITVKIYFKTVDEFTKFVDSFRSKLQSSTEKVISNGHRLNPSAKEFVAKQESVKQVASPSMSPSELMKSRTSNKCVDEQLLSTVFICVPFNFCMFASDICYVQRIEEGADLG